MVGLAGDPSILVLHPPWFRHTLVSTYLKYSIDPSIPGNCLGTHVHCTMEMKNASKLTMQNALSLGVRAFVVYSLSMFMKSSLVTCVQMRGLCTKT